MATMWNYLVIFSLVFFSQECLTQNCGTSAVQPTSLHNGLTESIGNFSIELLFFSSKNLAQNQNLIISPITVWTVLTVISEGATDRTRDQLLKTLRLGCPEVTRRQFNDIYKYLLVNTTTVQLAKVNTIFIDINTQLEVDFKRAVEVPYRVKVITLNFADNVQTANNINNVISNATRGRISKLVESSDFDNAKMLLTSAVYFKGQWTVPFNASSTEKRPFFDSTGKVLGNVNMMYNRWTYPFANIKRLQARVIEIPYGKENRLSMLIMLPNPQVTLHDMFKNFYNVPLDTLFTELRISKEDYGDDEIDCLIPRFKIDSTLNLTSVLRDMEIWDLFDERLASLQNMARLPLYATKVVHKAEIEVTEDGTTASAVTAAEFANRIGVIRFEANRPFAYMIVEKTTNSIVFGGVYNIPSLY